MNDKLKAIEKALFGYIEKLDSDNCKILSDAMLYSLKAGGKRIRPLLTLEFCKACGGDEEKAMPFACAVEMIHTYSLIHDDLPCMDNDDYRRGKPSNHKVFGEAFALLAGDALQSLAFEIMLSPKTGVPAQAALESAYILARCCGPDGMVGGQGIDLLNEGKTVSAEILREMDSKKTGALIKAACCMGCVAAGADEEKTKAAKAFAENIGIAFQIVDDILDVTSTSEVLGKPIGSDEENQKSTYVSAFGIEKCRELVNEYTQNAVDALDVFDGNKDFLKEFAKGLAKRQS